MFFYRHLSFARHFIRQAVEVTVNEKNRRSAPVMIAPITLVAANSIPKRTVENRTVPRIPLKRDVNTCPEHPLILWVSDAEIRIVARYATAMPKTTHKNAGVTVMTAVILRKAVIMPIIMLETIAVAIQLYLFSQPNNDIHFLPPLYII